MGKALYENKNIIWEILNFIEPRHGSRGPERKSISNNLTYSGRTAKTNIAVYVKIKHICHFINERE